LVVISRAVQDPAACLISASVAKTYLPDSVFARTQTNRPTLPRSGSELLAGMSVVLNAVDPVFMIDGKTAPDTDEQDEDYGLFKLKRGLVPFMLLISAVG
jgi:hypothetical protein